MGDALSFVHFRRGSVGRILRGRSLVSTGVLVLNIPFLLRTNDPSPKDNVDGLHLKLSLVSLRGGIC